MSKQANNQSKRFRPKFLIKKGDTVLILSGNDKGVRGRVLKVITKNGRAIVEGANMIKRHTKPGPAYPDGGIVNKEASIHMSNLMIVDPKTGEPCRVGRRLVDDKLVRYSKKTGEVID